MSATLFEVIGWTGTGLYLFTYLYLSFWRKTADRIYYGLNLLAAILIVVASVSYSTWQSVGLNAFWALVSLMAVLGRALRAKHFTRGTLAVGLGVLAAGAVVAAVADRIVMAISLLAWCSLIAFAGSYLLFANGSIRLRTFQAFNFLAAAALLPRLWLDGNWPVFALEVCWAVFSAVGLLRPPAAST